MARLLYSLAWWLALPLVLARLWWRGRREPGYREHLGERFGFYRQRIGAPVIWVHAVSVGETRAAEPLVNALLDAWPDHAILLTHMTATGRATGAELFGRHGARVVQSFLPYDTGFMVGRFLRHFHPRLGVLMETEVWPNVMAECARHRVPVALVNARLSERSLAKAERLPALMREAASTMACVAAQTDADALRLRRFGTPNVHVTGNLKFDVEPPAPMLAAGKAMRSGIGPRPVFLCASTREGEEALLLDAWLKRAREAGDGRDTALLLLVPRHPQRFDRVAQAIEERGLHMQRRSAIGDAAVSEDVQVLLGDTMGEMFAYYAACDLAYIGGSLLPFGGQNLIEACAVGKPVLLGPHTFNFAAASEDAIAAGAALRATDADALVNAASRLLASPAEREEMGRASAAFAQQHRGATARTLTLLRPLID